MIVVENGRERERWAGGAIWEKPQSFCAIWISRDLPWDPTQTEAGDTLLCQAPWQNTCYASSPITSVSTHYKQAVLKLKHERFNKEAVGLAG
jgi:hypothetical protein